MAQANSYLQVTELDFQQIRTNLKNFLSTQSQLQDYDYEGSVMATLLDVLAYNTHYNAYYLNMLANEMFLDTAQQRESVVSRAKELGYTPISSIGASANVTLSFSGVASNTASFVIPKNMRFTTTVDDVQYTYVTPEAYSVLNTNNTFTRSVTIKEGEPAQYRWVVNSANPVRYIIPNTNVDTSSIIVRVQNSQSDTTQVEFVKASNVRQVYDTSAVYFLEEAGDGKYEIVFGDGALGQRVVNGNIVIVEYLVCNGDETNGASSFTISSNPNIGYNYTGVTISSVNSAARGGRFAESVESIKFNAPRSYQTQNRCIVNNDYQRILLQENADLQSVVAYGGEEATPAVYGKVYIAVKPFGEQFITQSRKAELRASILDRTPLSIDPVFIDPEYTYLIANVTTYYDKTTTEATVGQIDAAIRSAITNYATTNLERFGNRLRYSRLARTLDNITVGNILNSNVSIKMQKRFAPNLDRAEKIELQFNNPIRPGTLTSTQFTYDGFPAFLDDTDGTVGSINIFRYSETKEKTYIKRGAGVIDYNTGSVAIEGFAPTAYLGVEMKVTVSPENFDIIPLKEQILILDVADATINVIGETT